jgi:hypothetical protein
MTAISDHFTWEEATVTHQRDPATGLALPNRPSPEASAQLVHTFQEMERVRGLFHKPIIIHSAYRSPAVNAAVGGSGTSQHLWGEAVDFIIPGLTPREVFKHIRRSGVLYDQLIEEAGSWIHISFVHDGRTPRRQGLTMRIEEGRAKYVAA